LDPSFLRTRKVSRQKNLIYKKDTGSKRRAIQEDPRLGQLISLSQVTEQARGGRQPKQVKKGGEVAASGAQGGWGMMSLTFEKILKKVLRAIKEGNPKIYGLKKQRTLGGGQSYEQH